MNLRSRFVPGVVVCTALALLFLLTSALAAQTFDAKLFNGMQWREIGPFRGGRVLAVTGVPGDPTTFYFGAVAGGVWRTTDAGSSWRPLFDKEPVSSVGAIAVAPSDPNVIYVGTGEACIRGNISFGDGVYKSTDAGKTWTHVGLEDTRHIGAIIVHPTNPDIVYVAALGHAYGTNPQRGIFRTTDGGKTWEKVLYKDEKTGGIDVVFDPNNPRILFAALWEAHRTPYSLVSGGPGSGLYRSTDGGTTWTHLEGHGLPAGVLGKIGVSVSGADSNRVYALIEAEKGGLYRSDDGGESWKLVNPDTRFRQRAWYFTHVFADPQSVDTVYILNTGMFRSTDGGAKFNLIPAPHGDHHGLWIDPTNPKRMINGNDGGATITLDGGQTWSTQNNQPTAQFYHVTTDNQWPYYVYGAQQDNSTVAIASRTSHGVIGRGDWYDVGGCESGYIAPDPRDANIVYAGCYAGILTRLDRRTDQQQVVSPWPVNNSGWSAAELKHRLQWTAPVIISPHDPDVLYEGLEVLFKTTDGGMSWTAISPDLTRNDKSKQQASGGPITKDQTGVEYYDNIFTIAESPVQKGLIWVGTDDGLVQLTRDGGQHWENVTPKGVPEWSMMSLIEASSFDAGTAYLAVDAHKLDDFAPYIFKTHDYGKTWTRINDGISAPAYVHAVREDPVHKGLLYTGTETGVYVSFDDGAHWQSLQLNLPTTPIHDLVVKDNDLIVGTHGRSFWILDDITPLRQLDAQMAGDQVHLYQPRPTVRMRGLGGWAPRGPYGKNPPDGAIVYYYLKDEPKDEVTLDILDAAANVIRHYSSKEKEQEEEGLKEWPDLAETSDRLPAKAGMNRFTWDLHYEPPTKVPGAVFDGGEPPKGPLALPGSYQARLTVAGKTYTQPFVLNLDPRVSVSAADLHKQFDLLRKISDGVSAANGTVNQIDALRKQLHTLRHRLTKEKRGADIVQAAEALDKKADAIEDALIQKKIRASEDSLNFPVRLNNRISALGDMVESADAAPTAQSYDVYNMLKGQLDAQLAKWQEIVNQDLPAFNALVAKEQIPAISLPPAEGGGH